MLAMDNQIIKWYECTGNIDQPEREIITKLISNQVPFLPHVFNLLFGVLGL